MYNFRFINYDLTFFQPKQAKVCMVKPDPIPLQEIPREVQSVFPDLDKNIEKFSQENGLKVKMTIGCPQKELDLFD